MSAYVIAEVVVKDKERYAAEFVPIVSKAPCAPCDCIATR